MKSWTINEVIVLGTALIIMVIITFLCKFFLEQKSNHIKNLPLNIIAITMIVLEGIKQIYFIFHGYIAQWLPFHFCSLFFVWFTLGQFGKGKFKQLGQTMAIVSSIMLLIVFYITPRSIIGNSCAILFHDFYSFHTVLYHNLVFLYFFILLALKQYRPNESDFLYIFISLSIYLVVVVCAAYITKYNFTNILYSQFAPLEFIRVHTNQAFYILLLFAIGVMGAFLIRFIYGKIYEYLDNKRCNVNSE